MRRRAESTLEDEPEAQRRRVSDTTVTRDIDSEQEDESVDDIFTSEKGTKPLADSDDENELELPYEQDSTRFQSKSSTDQDAVRGDPDHVENWAREVQDAEEDDYDDAQRAYDGIGQKPDDVPIMAFNLKEERRGGDFDSDGFYVSNAKKMTKRTFGDVNDDEEEGASEDDERDQWIDQWNEKSERERANSASKFEALMKRRSDEEKIEAKRSLLSSLVVLNAVIQRGESVLESLRRLPKFSNSLFDEVTEIAKFLMDEQGVIDIYEKTWEEVSRMVNSLIEKNGIRVEKKWEYKLDLDSPSAEVFGPYASSEMEEWKKAGYFGDSNPAFVRMMMAGYDGSLSKDFISSSLITTFL